ncbi:zinc ribbon domain-containing protein [Mahella australiensis]|uniref:C4-type zinc ribbon domain-containing protein n=1 Tax=Mahella australiensis (strain DSM 15567 / CIP 107919 / 50-1 BON) TaxID=697281 RepID=F3ZXL4_MAHA5|nr:C4-type zinc ribbon domain-containing protein [Mahella australiensis]AEE95521.1 protein of unknown function DUF164 [Mahella australiensis 50-1 BON]
MEQLDYLWRYQEIEDMLDRYNKERKKIPLSVQLNKLKKDILDKQEAISEMGKLVKEKNEAYKQIRGRYETLSKEFYGDKERLSSANKSDSNELKELNAKAGSYINDLTAIRSDLQALKPDIDRLDADLIKARNELKQMSEEYNQLKKQYEAQIKEIGISADELRKEKQELKARIDKELMDKYQMLRKHKQMAIALVDKDKCSGCNMSLPSAILTAVKEGKKIIECENCGRILYYNKKDEK